MCSGLAGPELQARGDGSGRLRRRIKPKEALDEWFHVGNNLRCLYNPTNPDAVVVFPFATQSDRLTLGEADSPHHMYFESAT